MRQKQEPVFSTLEEMELDISSREKEKDRIPSEEILTRNPITGARPMSPAISRYCWQIRFPICPGPPESAFAMRHSCTSHPEALSWEARNMSRVEAAMKRNMKSR